VKLKRRLALCQLPAAAGERAATLTDAVTYPGPLNDLALAATWHAAWSSLGVLAPAGLREELMAAWSQPHRSYHDVRHLGECLALWTHWRHHSPRPGEVAVALWFHDAVCEPQAHSNELRSAAWAARCLVSAGVDSDTAQRVHDLVMATAHISLQATASGLSANPDAQLLLDIDLSILGSPPERFERYDQDVRKEYVAVTGARYQAARAQVLQGFLDRPKILQGEQAAALLEAQAGINLNAALSRLAQ